jgi:exosome complex component MTR3
VERDLGVHLETALRGVIIGERWPKSGVEVIVTVIEGEEDAWWGDNGKGGEGWGAMSVLAGAITVASAAIADAGIDCVDLVSGGVSAVVRDGGGDAKGKQREGEVLKDGEALVLDPCPAEHMEIVAACVVGYLAGRDEVTEIWMKGEAGGAADVLLDKAVYAAAASVTVVREAVRESVERKFQDVLSSGDGAFQGAIAAKEVEMTS